MDIVTSKEEPQVLKIKLPDYTHINMPIFSHGNTEEYLAQIIAALHIIKQKGLDAKCRKLGKAVVRQMDSHFGWSYLPRQNPGRISKKNS
jgi:hypothetical protein